ncbi:MAG: hypothetical protein IH948_09085 [Bacteroidetes bacterium]|nr:hypothetical protein [Bacteroidota bacterium]
MIVVDDVPTLGIFHKAPHPVYNKAAGRIYNSPEVSLLRRDKGGNTSALLRGLLTAEENGAELVFIHLDDSVYLPIFDKLFRSAVDAFTKNQTLQVVRFTGEPILSGKCTSEKGNLSQIKVEKDRVSFGNVAMKPHAYDSYRLWSSDFHNRMVDGYWPITLWFCLYRLRFLKKLLMNSGVKKIRSLGYVELYYKDPSNWEKLIRIYPGKIGYINMQFAGLEMTRNRNWKELISFPNTAL